MTLVWRPGFSGLTDADAIAYVAAVEAADGQALEFGVGKAINDFIVGCKLDGTWNAIKASCILAGARTLNGALVPLVGTAPNRFGTEGGWNYNRKTGLQGNGTDNYLNSNRSNNADPRDNNHNACWVSTTATGALMASSASNTGQNYMDIITTPGTRFASRTALATTDVSGATQPGLYGHARSSSSGQFYRCPQGSGSATTGTQTGSLASQIPENRNVFLYTRTNDSITFSAWSAARLAFYSIGESLNLALLDTRVTALITAIGAAIP